MFILWQYLIDGLDYGNNSNNDIITIHIYPKYKKKMEKGLNRKEKRIKTFD